MITRTDNLGTTYLIKESKDKKMDMFTLFSYFIEHQHCFTVHDGELMYYDNELSLRVCFGDYDSKNGHNVYFDSEWMENFNTRGIAIL